MSTRAVLVLALVLLFHIDACISHLLWSHGAGSSAQRAVANAQREEVVDAAREQVARARNWAQSSLRLAESDGRVAVGETALSDCVQLYEDCEDRLRRLGLSHGREDARTWISGALSCHRTCLGGLREQNAFVPKDAENITVSLSSALAFYHALPSDETDTGQLNQTKSQELLVSWEAYMGRADFVVAKDGSGNYKTINEAVVALAQRRQRRPNRVVIYVKSGVYNENVEIGRAMKHVMFVGDGIDRTIVTGNRNAQDGSTTFRSATFGVSGDGFWARDMTFENTAGPAKHQAVALRVGSDHSVFYRCSFRGYQDTLLVHSQRQFYRDCHIYGTIDFIFGNAAAVFQNCDIHVRRPMGHQANMITAQGRGHPFENTGISIHGSRVAPASDFQQVKGSFKTFLGRPWQQYSRTVFMKTDLDGLIDPSGWAEWKGGFGLATLYFGEYMNSGEGAVTRGRVKWPGFHVVSNPRDADPFTVARFIQGETWIPETGVPFIPGL